jgi:hypothetical protein
MIRTRRQRETVLAGGGYLIISVWLFLGCYLPSDGPPFGWSLVVGFGIPLGGTVLAFIVIQAVKWIDRGEC